MDARVSTQVALVIFRAPGLLEAALWADGRRGWIGRERSHLVLLPVSCLGGWAAVRSQRGDLGCWAWVWGFLTLSSKESSWEVLLCALPEPWHWPVTALCWTWRWIHSPTLLEGLGSVCIAHQNRRPDTKRAGAVCSRLLTFPTLATFWSSRSWL